MTQPAPPGGEPPTPPTAATVRVRRPTPKGLLLSAIAVVVGIPVLTLALAGIGYFRSPTREQLYTAAMKSDLRNLVTAEEDYFTSHATFTTSLESLWFTPSENVTVTVRSATGTGWSATAKRILVTTTCDMFVGSATATITGQNEGWPKCAVPVDSSARPPDVNTR